MLDNLVVQGLIDTFGVGLFILGLFSIPMFAALAAAKPTRYS